MKLFLCGRCCCCFDVNVNLYNSRGSEEGTQASAEERFQGQEEEEVGQTTIEDFFLGFYSIGGGIDH